MDALDRILAQETLGPDDLETLLSLEDPDERARVHDAAYRVKLREVGPVAYLRGLIEITNVCVRDCLYCGIRQSNDAVDRYEVDEDEVLAAARWAWDKGFGSAVLQGGERCDARFVEYIERILQRMQGFADGGLGVTLSLGEQSEDTLRRWRRAGAQRYLLRIETTDRELFAAIHADGQDFDERLACLRLLRACGYQVGTGVMIGLPGQTAADLARDVVFMRDQDVDMVGMGPFIPHEDTPMADSLGDFDHVRDEQLELGLLMIACVRLALRDVNIASTTALQALAPDGRERGMRAGANILMPNLTDTRYRAGYQLYDGKPGLAEDSDASTRALERAVAAIGETIGYHQLGTSPRFLRRRA
jgi:biotin synthase